MKAGSLQVEAGCGMVEAEALVQEALGGEVGPREATAAKEKIGLSLKGGLKHGVSASSGFLSISCISLSTGCGNSSPLLIIPTWVTIRSTSTMKRKQRRPIFAIFKVQSSKLNGSEPIFTILPKFNNFLSFSQSSKFNCMAVNQFLPFSQI